MLLVTVCSRPTFPEIISTVLALLFSYQSVLAAFRFGDPKMSKPENKAFAQMFQKQFAGKFLELYMKLLSVVRENGYLPDRVINLALQYLSTRYLLGSILHCLAKFYSSVAGQ